MYDFNRLIRTVPSLWTPMPMADIRARDLHVCEPEPEQEPEPEPELEQEPEPEDEDEAADDARPT